MTRFDSLNLFTLSAAFLMSSQGMAIAHPGHVSGVETTTAINITQAEQPGMQRGGDERRAPMEAIELPDPVVTITFENGFRIIESNGLPGHETGTFPNNENPNAIRPQSHRFKLPLAPTLAEEPIIARPEFGVAVNGVIFDAGTGEFWTVDQDPAFGGGSEWNYEAQGGGVPFGLDRNNAHVQPTGKYHYHGIPTGLLESISGEDGMQQLTLLGWAFDGFPIYGPSGFSDAWDQESEVRELRTSYQLKSGDRPSPPDGPGEEYDGTFGLDYEYIAGSGDLDECNGRFGVTPEYPQGTYYYVVSDAFPQVPRFWRGQPDESMQRRGSGQDQAQGQGQGERRRPGPGGQRRQRPGN